MADYKKSLPVYHTAAWQRARAEALKRDRGMCRDCMDKFDQGVGIRPRRAMLVHHVIPVSERPDLALALNNLRSLCEACHNKRHPEKGCGRQEAQRAPATRMRVIKI